jgi:hypothetical protein
LDDFSSVFTTDPLVNYPEAQPELVQVPAEEAAEESPPTLPEVVSESLTDTTDEAATEPSVETIETAAEALKPYTSEYVRQTYREAKKQAKLGNREEALNLLRHLVEIEPDHVAIWRMIADLSSVLADKIEAMEKVLEMRPNDVELRKNLQQLKKVQDDPWQRARQFEEVGDFELAVFTYLNIATHSESPAERVEANRRALSLKQLQASTKIKEVHPTVNLLRLTVGLPLLFFMLIFIQAGLNPLQMSAFALVSLGSVVVGSLLITVTNLRPLHPGWVNLFGHPGSHSEMSARLPLQILGWLLIIVPFILFFIEATLRLMRLWNIVVPQMLQ